MPNDNDQKTNKLIDKGASKELKKTADARGVLLESETPPRIIHLLPLTERPFFPPQVAPMMLNEEPWLSTLNLILKEEGPNVVGLVMVKPDSAENLVPADFHKIGTLVRMHHPNHDDGRLQFIAQGMKRFRIKRWISKTIPYIAQVEYLDDSDFENTEQLRAYSMAVVNALKELVPLNPLYSEELKHFLTRFNTNEPSPLADFAASLTTSSKEDMQVILATVPILNRMKKVVALIHKELEVARLQSKIREQVDEKITDQQRKFFLREQLKVIQQELGLSKDDRTADLDKFMARLNNKTIPEIVQKKLDEEFDKLSILESGSPEYAVTRNYLDLITDLPWGIVSQDNYDLSHARTVLSSAHFGLDEVKDRLIESLAIGQIKGEIKGSIILLVGPPGVGKTSIGKSIAESLNRKFFRFSLGGARDEAEIKGHRRTYIGAMPGKLIQALKETQVENPVIMLDEVDKMGQSYQGDPASALLEVLDPEQNVDFLDHYLDVRYDLSKTLFICTANSLDSIPAALLDRMEVIRLSGYILEEKLQIAILYLWPRLLEKAGFKDTQLTITEKALTAVIDRFARDAGVRQLEKYLAKLIRKVAVKFVEEKITSFKIGVSDIEKMLGQASFSKEKPLRGIGVITGLAWTSMGGVTLSLEAAKVHTKTRGLQITGQLGGVMQESANIAYNYLCANTAALGADPKFFDDAFIHVHAPEGATPKDGPSAGVTIASAILSLALNKEAKPFAMTGELTLTGKVLPIGGVKEKLIAARRVGIKDIIFPKANEADFKELPDNLKKGITAHFVSDYKDVAKLLF
ncbi:lon protease [Gammaproteobacteria bacterium]|nr:lon protease [Gammaproteobacteria bacterium]